jgi:hypothetical protein
MLLFLDAAIARQIVPDDAGDAGRSGSGRPPTSKSAVSSRETEE